MIPGDLESNSVQSLEMAQEMRCEVSRCGLHGEGRGAFAFQRGHGDAIDAARGDGGEAGEVAGDIDGEAVLTDPMAGADANAGEFPVFHPNAGETVPPAGGDAEGLTAIDEGLLQRPQIVVQVLAVADEVQHRIANQLPRAMPGGLPSSSDFHQRGREIASAETAAVKGAADGENGVMLQQENSVRIFSGEVAGEQVLLQFKAVRIGHAAQPADSGRGDGRRGSGRRSRVHDTGRDGPASASAIEKLLAKGGRVRCTAGQFRFAFISNLFAHATAESH